MRERVHRMLNDLAAATGLVRAFFDGKISPDRAHVAHVLDALESLDDGMAHLQSEMQLRARIASSKSEFIATMSHELRTPLSAIVGATEMLARTSLAAREQILVATIHESAEALFALVGSILDLSKIEAGKLDLRYETFDLAPLVGSALDVVAPLLHEKGVRAIVQVDPAIPQLVGDPGRLRQILLNLVGNAAKFTERGEVAVHAVLVDASEARISVRFEIADTGIAIASEYLTNLFEPFAQARLATQEKFGGNGLGLSISQRLANLLGGTIRVDSEIGRGSCFDFTIAFARAAGGTRPVDDPAFAAPYEVGAWRGGPIFRTILVAEDDPRLQTVLRLQFDELAIAVEFVSDGRAAVDAVRDGRFSMVLMDCQLPVLDGLAATVLIRKSEEGSDRHVGIVAMTARAFSEDRDACLSAGMDEYLAKPIRLADLRAVIERWAALSSPR